MRQLIAPAVLMLALVVLIPSVVTAQIVSVTPMSHDFGNMKQMQTRTATVTVTNNGAALLVITGVDADCGCTVPTLTKTSLVPEESTDIVIEFSSKRFNGSVTKVVHINTNDPLNPVVDIVLTAVVSAPLLIDPPSQRLGFTQTLAGESSTRRLTLTATGTDPIKITADKTRKGLFEIEVINNLDGNPQMAAVDVSIPVNMKPGHQRDNLRVTTNIAEFPTLDIEMQAWIVQELMASPERVAYRFKKDLRQSIRVAPFRKGIEYKVTGAECDLPELKIEVIETIVNRETKVLISGAPISKDDPRAVEASGRLSGTLKIYTNLKNTPVLEIPITYMVRM